MNIKTATIIAAIAAFTAAAQAELTTVEFVKVKSWAETRGYLYDGIGQWGRFATKCFVFTNRQNGDDYLCAYAPISSDTADEAINALIASAVTFDVAVAAGHQVRREAYAEGYQDGKKDTSTAVAAKAIPAGVPAAVMARIRAKAENEWPDNYSMQRFEIKRETEAYLALHNASI